jgi:hypothetical protein
MKAREAARFAVLLERPLLERGFGAGRSQPTTKEAGAVVTPLDVIQTIERDRRIDRLVLPDTFGLPYVCRGVHEWKVKKIDKPVETHLHMGSASIADTVSAAGEGS